MILGTDFTAYNVYRATCKRCGFVDPNNRDWGSNLSGFEMYSHDGRELYMEFDEMSLIEQGMPDEIGLEGLGVEVHVHFSAISLSPRPNVYNSFRADYFYLGICGEKINAESGITYNNMPTRKYVRTGSDLSTRWHEVFGYSQHSSKTPFVSNSEITDVHVMSYIDASPLDVLHAIKDSAVVVRLEGSTDVRAAIEVTGNYTPYVEIVYGVVRPRIERLRPDGGYISANTQQKLAWDYVCADGVSSLDSTFSPYHYIFGGQCAQDFATVTLWPENTNETAVIDVAGEANSCVVPQNVLNAGGFTWCVSARNVLGAQSDTSSIYSITTVDSISMAEIVFPKNTYVNVGDAAVFAWTHIIATGTPQSKYELQGLMGGVWTTLQEEETSETSAVVPVGKLSSNITAWRVRTANNDCVYGEYSDPAQVIFVVAPSVGGVTVTGNVKPVIAWQSGDQQGYEIMIDDISTGVIYGTEKSYAWQELLADGEHAVKVRVVNRFGLFSQWVESAHEVANVPLTSPPALQAIALSNSDVRLDWSAAESTKTMIYRDGVLIDNVQQINGTYIDHTAHSRHVYRVRAVAADGNYANSNTVIATAQLRETMLADVEEWSWVELAYSSSAEPPVRMATLAPVYALNYYSGRVNPVAEMSRHRSASYSMTYAVTDRQAAQLRGMMGKIVVHKRKGEVLRGLLQGVSETRTWWGVDVTLQIAEVDEG